MFSSILALVLATSPACAPDDLSCLEWGCSVRRSAECSALAQRYESGKGVPKDLARAAALRERARAQDDKNPDSACRECQATCARSLEACQKLCATQTHACFLLGLRQMERSGEEATRTLRKACDQGHPDACASLASFLMRGKRPPAEYLPLLEKGCQGRAASACGLLGLLSISGQGVKKDSARGARLLGQSCEQGYAPGCGYLGQAYENGDGVPADEPRAALIYQRACDGAGNAMPYRHACFTLADLYDEGKYLPKDVPRAIALYRKCCGPESREGCGRLKALGGRAEPGPGNPATPEELAAVTALGKRIAEADRAAAYASDLLQATSHDRSKLGVFVATLEQAAYVVQFGRVTDDGRAFVAAKAFRAPRGAPESMKEIELLAGAQGRRPGARGDPGAGRSGGCRRGRRTQSGRPDGARGHHRLSAAGNGAGRQGRDRGRLPPAHGLHRTPARADGAPAPLDHPARQRRAVRARRSSVREGLRRDAHAPAGRSADRDRRGGGARAPEDGAALRGGAYVDVPHRRRRADREPREGGGPRASPARAVSGRGDMSRARSRTGSKELCRHERLETTC
ncbi:MAG: tetratricopeptide repeat protein [Myxococcales bacterium]